jgi:hypothetical protein
MGSVVHEKMKHRTKLASTDTTASLRPVPLPCPRDDDVTGEILSRSAVCRYSYAALETGGVRCGVDLLRCVTPGAVPDSRSKHLEVGRATAATHQCTTHRRRAASASSTTRPRVAAGSPRLA